MYKSKFRKIRKIHECAGLKGALHSCIMALLRRVSVQMHEKYIDVVWEKEDFKGGQLPVIQVDPSEVKYQSMFPFKTEYKGRISGIVGGEWDMMKYDIHKEIVFRSVLERYGENIKWENTPIYKHSLDKVTKGKKAWNGCSSKSEIKERCKKIDRLYESMVENGFKPEMKWSKRVERKVPDTVRVAISREGNLIRIENGRHRLAIAQLLGLEKMPAIVQIVHRKFKNSESFF